MPARLVDSQFETLEPLERDEPGMTLDATADLPMNLARVRAGVERCAGRPGP
jgi:gluconokinase